MKRNTYYTVGVIGVTTDKVSVVLSRRNILIFTWPDNICCDTLAIYNIRLFEILGRIEELYSILLN